MRWCSCRLRAAEPVDAKAVGLGERLWQSWKGPRGWGAVTALAISAMVLSGCRGRGGSASDGVPVLGRITVRPTPAAMIRGTSVVLDDSRIAGTANDVLASSGIFAKDAGGDKKRSRADVAITLEILADSASPDAEVGIKVRLKIEPHPSTAVTVRYAEDTAALGQAPLGKTAAAELMAAFQRLAVRTTEDLLRAYVARQRLWSANEPAIAQALMSADGDLRLEAVRIVGARKLTAQLPTVIRLLSDGDEATRDAALGAVVALGDRSAIKALADSRQMRDSYEMSKVVDGVASLGGQEARDYLSFVADTHDDPDIRKMAQAALMRLKMREAKSAPTR